MTAVPGVSERDYDIEDGFNEQSNTSPVRKHSEKLQRSRPPIGPRSYSYGSGGELRGSQPGRKSSSQDLPLADAAGNELVQLVQLVSFFVQEPFCFHAVKERYQ